MHEDPIALADLAACLADVVDSVDASVAGHHRRVAALCQALGAELGLEGAEREEVVLAAAVHDIGVLSLSERLGALRFDVDDTDHSEPGYLLLRDFQPFSRIASIIRWHHLWWHDAGAVTPAIDEKLLLQSQLLFFADRTAVLLSAYEGTPACLERIRSVLRRSSGTMLSPAMVECACDLPDEHAFWRVVAAPAASIGEVEIDSSVMLPWHCLEDFATTVSRLIDFRCSFTATHSSGVAACAVALAIISGMPPADVRMIRIAGYLHDIGKLAVPRELISKAGALTDDEFAVIKSHVVFSNAVLWRLGSPPDLQRWVGSHHERPNGTGYPAGLSADDLDLGCRIIALADVFVALAEDRPYRSALSREQTMEILTGMAERGDLDATLVALLIERFDEVDHVRASAQRVSSRDFERFRAQVAGMRACRD